MGAEPRLRIMRSAVVSASPRNGSRRNRKRTRHAGSSLSHHLEKLKNEGLVNVKRESTFLRYSAKPKTLQELLGFLYAECCTRNQADRTGSYRQDRKVRSRIRRQKKADA